ncbi:hypothetical protein BTO05_03860 [Winogradskyella sp. PC-19]|uniref:hypothetical protein n=1 Tax=unclassified Winogradskyella TaxID=2615021 RepID=UPI000B3CECBC|nr:MULTISPECIES: hypothetical protein [unclassified Winogradskyella]ARV08815.1 hypothetical protein BTO05_03860 [Winogradskyella sp. PC-19]RZN75984.1 MAG: hypothetical protein EVB12_06755 [Winogradskyella sp.]
MNTIKTQLASILVIALVFSCEQKSSSNISESELINKINAVQQQVMVQGNISEEEEQALLSLCSIISKSDGLGDYSPDNRMVLKDVDIAPVYEGCEELSAEETKACFNTKVATFIKREFNLKLSKDLNLAEQKQVEAFFIIDENGNRTGMKVRDAEVSIQAEILRVLRKMPIMKPANHNGKNVSVLCSLVLKYGNDIEVDVVYIPERPNN